MSPPGAGMLEQAAYSTAGLSLVGKMDKMVCVGKNYLDHAQELGDAVPSRPVLFIKPPSVALQASHPGETLHASMPTNRGAVHYECEICLRLNERGSIDAVTLGLDLTLRDVQRKLKDAGHPWEVGKVFRHSAVLGPWVPAAAFPHYLQEEFELQLDGRRVQHGRGAAMRMAPAEILTYIAEHFPLCPNDVIFTGTPAGVGPLAPGQLASLRWGDKLAYQVQF